MQSGKMKIFGCGGCGTNLAANYVGAKKEAMSAEITPVFIDTSRSNIGKHIPDESCYILPDLDGSGKVRSENYEKIKDVIRDILHKHKPQAFNVVVSSASGGSGSVIAPLIVSELLSRGETVVIVVVGSDESDITAKNTLNTLKSLEGVSKNTGKTVVMHYRHNTRGKARTDVDNELHYAISTLAVLASKNVRELDTKDIYNWINFNKTTSVEARLAALEIFGSDAPWGEYNPISVISIYKDADQATLPIVPEYHAAGYADVMGLPAIHYLIDVTAPGKFAARINATLKELDEARKSRPSLGNIITTNDKKTDDGLVL